MVSGDIGGRSSMGLGRGLSVFYLVLAPSRAAVIVQLGGGGGLSM